MAKYMVLLLKQSLTVDFRLAAFKDDRFVDMCTFTASQIPHTRHFLEPSEKNRELLDVYFIALLSGRLTSEKNEFLYKIAVHHTCAFLFGDLPGRCGWVIDATQSIGGADEAKHAVEQRAGAVRQLLLAAHDELYRDVAFYQYTAAGVPSCASLRQGLPMTSAMERMSGRWGPSTKPGSNASQHRSSSKVPSVLAAA